MPTTREPRTYTGEPLSSEALRRLYDQQTRLHNSEASQTCKLCKKNVDRRNLTTVVFQHSDGRPIPYLICPACLKTHPTKKCDVCHRKTYQGHMVREMCPVCITKRYTSCRDCGGYYEPKELTLRHCKRCIDNSRAEPTNLHYFSPVQSIGNEKSTFNIINVKRAFGVELESSTNRVKMADHEFSAVRDGSISGQEFVSPILMGDPGAAAIERVCSLAPSVDERCGFHLHINATDLSWWDLVMLGRGYFILQPILFLMVPPKRRGSRHCKHIVTPFFSFERKRDLTSHIYGMNAFIPRERDKKYNSKRYEFINFHSYFYHGTVEIRHHEGTFDLTDIVNWTNFNLALFEHMRKAKITDDTNPFTLLHDALTPELRDYVRRRIMMYNADTMFPITIREQGVTAEGLCDMIDRPHLYSHDPMVRSVTQRRDNDGVLEKLFGLSVFKKGLQKAKLTKLKKTFSAPIDCGAMAEEIEMTIPMTSPPIPNATETAYQNALLGVVERMRGRAPQSPYRMPEQPTAPVTGLTGRLRSSHEEATQRVLVENTLPRTDNTYEFVTRYDVGTWESPPSLGLRPSGGFGSLPDPGTPVVRTPTRQERED